MADWSQLPKDLLGSVAKRLNFIEDYMKFGVVCQSWRSVTIDQLGFSYSPKTLPWLMFPLCTKDEDEHDNDIDIPNFFSLSENKYHKISFPEVQDCCLSGSAYGWLVAYSGRKVEIFNPLSRVCVALPPLPTSRNLIDHYRAVLAIPSYSSFKPATDQFVVLVSSLRKLVFARPQDRAWTTVEIGSSLIVDILHLNDQFYAIDGKGIIRQFDITSPNPILTEFSPPPTEIDPYRCGFYLVELLGELHMVLKNISMRSLSESHHFEPGSRPFVHSQMVHFTVFKLDLDTRKWEQVFTLGDYAIFVGCNTSFSLLVSGYPCCKGNSIYFTDERMGEGHTTGNIGVFNLETHSLKTLFTGDDVGSLYCVPVWFIPNLC